MIRKLRNKTGVIEIALLGIGVGFLLSCVYLEKAGKVGDKGEWANEQSRAYHASRVK